MAFTTNQISFLTAHRQVVHSRLTPGTDLWTSSLKYLYYERENTLLRLISALPRDYEIGLQPLLNDLRVGDSREELEASILQVEVLLRLTCYLYDPDYSFPFIESLLRSDSIFHEEYTYLWPY